MLRRVCLEQLVSRGMGMGMGMQQPHAPSHVHALDKTLTGR